MGILGKGERAVSTTNRNLCGTYGPHRFRNVLVQSGSCCCKCIDRLYYRPNQIKKEAFHMNAHGIVHKYGDNVDTDVSILPVI